MRSIVLTLLFLAFPALSETIDVAKMQSSKVEWLAVGNPGFLKIESKNSGLTGEMRIDEGNISGTFISHLDDMKTGIKLRDDHTKEKYLETKKYPNAKFVLNPVKVASAFNATGTMSLHGADKEITWECQAAKGGSVRKISCITKVILTDFNIEVPSYLGVTIAKEVRVKVLLVI